MKINNPPKFYGILLVIFCATILCAIGRLEAVEYIALVGPFAGYLVGNGVNTRRGETTEPPLAPRPPEAPIEAGPGRFDE